MSRTKTIQEGIKYTVVLPESDVEQLKEMAKDNTIPSVNAAIREAVADYIARIKKQDYKKSLIDAVSDSEFIKRTTETMESYHIADAATEELMQEW